MKVDHAAFDSRLHERVRQGRLNEAVAEAIKLYGPEIYTLLVSIHRSHQDANDVFSLFCERVWKGLARFEGRSSFRTWAYTIAWHASSSFRDQQHARREELITDSQLGELARQVRAETLSRLRNEKRSRLREIRETLPAEDQLLLVLRVERELDWKDLSRVMNPDAELDDDALTRESARLRQRFQAVKQRLRALIQADTTGP
jgi:RNA polymerase sigma-70 factor (ECF subfamily)